MLNAAMVPRKQRHNANVRAVCKAHPLDVKCSLNMLRFLVVEKMRIFALSADT